MKASDFYAMVDASVAASFERSEVKPCCPGKGCSHCCSEPLYADMRAVDYIIDGMTSEQRAEAAKSASAWMNSVRDRAIDLIAQERPRATEWRARNIPCPLLKDGACSVYDRRPIDCRLFAATGNPNDCAMPMRKHQKFADYPQHQLDQLMIPWFKVPGTIVLDHLGILLAERLTGEGLNSGARMIVGVS